MARSSLPLPRYATATATGVSHTREGKFRAVLYVERKQIYLGVYNDEVSAARAHDKGVMTHGLGEAYLNFKVKIPLLLLMLLIPLILRSACR